MAAGGEGLGVSGAVLALPGEERAPARVGLRRVTRSPVVPWLVLALMLVAALGIRMYRLDEPPLNFHATRQYRSLLIARGYYYEGLESVPAWKRHVAHVTRERQGVLEPPVIERLVAAAYRLAGGERFWIPRMLSSLLWLGGGVALWLIALRMGGSGGALLAAGVYLFLPFAVVASRSFQPDPLMVFLVLTATWLLLRHAERATPLRLGLAAAVAAAAVLVKPVAAFPVLTAFALLEIGRGGVRALVRPGAVAFLVASLAPALVFYGQGMAGSGTLREQARSSWLPALVLDPFFWQGWRLNVEDVIGLPLLVGALVGVLVCRWGPASQLLLGLWAGYALFCLAFSYHIATHDYYHLLLVPIVALSLAPLAGLVERGLRRADGSMAPVRRLGLAAVVALALLGGALETRTRMVARSGLEDQPRVAAEIGERVGHSTNTVYLSSDYGLSLEYHGFLAGRPWPLSSDLEWERLAGEANVDAATRFEREYAPRAPEYFIVADQRELERQPDLKAFLAKHFAPLASTDRYQVFDLRR